MTSLVRDLINTVRGEGDTSHSVDAHMQRVLDQLAALHGQAIENLDATQARAQPSPNDAVAALLRAEGRDPTPTSLITSVKSEDRNIPAGGTTLSSRIYTPAGNGPFPLVVYFHGGGWVIADKDSYDAGARGLSEAAGAIVVSVDYRRAPEHKFPTAWNDAIAAYDWVAANANALNGDASRIALAGESAGGNLAVATAVAARNRGANKAIAILAIYPVAQTGNTETQSYDDSGNARPLNKAMIGWFLDKLVTGPADKADTRLDLINADLVGLPPVTIINAEIDPLRSDGEMLETALKEAGVEVTRKVYGGVTHEFFGMAAVVPKAQEAVQFAGEQLRRAFAGAVHTGAPRTGAAHPGTDHASAAHTGSQPRARLAPEDPAATKLKVVGYAAKHSFSELKPFEFEREAARTDEIEIDVLFCGVCHSDIHQIKNEWDNTVYPCVPGHEVVGRVTRVGSSVTRHAVGDLVGVGCMIDSCRQCEPCLAGDENYCEGPNSWLATYNGPMIPAAKAPGGTNMYGRDNTYGGYSSVLVVQEDFALKIPANLRPELAAPILCAGVTTYSPLKHWGVKPGDRVGIIGFGGLGDMAAKLAVAMGAEVTLFTTSKEKITEAGRLGATAILESDEEALQALHGKFDFLLSTIPQKHDINPYIPLLKRDKTICIVGALEPMESVNNQAVAFHRKNVAGSLIGSLQDTQEVLDFCAQHDIGPDIELINMDQVNDAVKRAIGGDVRFRSVINMASIKPDPKNASVEDSAIFVCE
jgi:uncharacterized zinc-type alcohol dehydrogenase-like protein